MAKKASRVADQHVCPLSTSGVPHVGGPVLPPGAATVWINDQPAARATDRATCVGPVDFIVTGAGTVMLMDQNAARMTDHCMHGGTLVQGSTNVEIDGPTVGAVLGNPTRGAALCQEAAAGRTSGQTNQSYPNCGVEASRLVIREATGNDLGEEALLDRAMDNGWATRRATRERSGGSSPGEREALLRDQGVESHQEGQSMSNITQAVAEGRGVITSHVAGRLWGTAHRGGHAVQVTGLRYDADGNLTHVITNDTGRANGNCSREYTTAAFSGSLRSTRNANVTDEPIW